MHVCAPAIVWRIVNGEWRKANGLYEKQKIATNQCKNKKYNNEKKTTSFIIPDRQLGDFCCCLCFYYRSTLSGNAVAAAISR